MAKSVEIPQDIIDRIIAEVGDDTPLLKQCSLVSSSFLLPSRRQLFEKITLNNDQACQRIYLFLVQNPLLQSSVRAITVSSWGSENTAWMNCTLLSAILRLPFYLKTLELHFVSPDDFRSENLSSLGPTASHVAVERCVWHLIEKLHMHGPTAVTESIFLPFMCRLRCFEIYALFGAATMHDFGILSSLIGSLCMSLTSPATLERLDFNISFNGNAVNNFDNFKFYQDLPDVWSLLDSITTHPTGSRLRRVNIYILYW